MTGLNIGIIGCGEMGRAHSEVLSTFAQIRSLSFCDTMMDRAEELGILYQGRRVTSDAEELMADPELDALYICTHHDSHASLIVSSADAGKHIFVEKPLAMNLDEVAEIEHAVDRSGVIVMVGFKLRFYDLVRETREWIAEPALSIAQVTDTRWPDSFWGSDPVKGGGNVFSQGCHAIDLLCYLHDSHPVRVSATGGAITHADRGDVDTMAATLEFENGSIASLVVSDCGIPAHVSKFSFQLFDENRNAHLHDRLTSLTLSDGENSRSLRRTDEDGVRNENVEFIRALEEQRQPACNLSDGSRALHVLLEAYKSIQTGQPVRIQRKPVTNN